MKKILFAEVDLYKLENGYYYIGSNNVLNSPVPSSTSFTVEVSQNGNDGFMFLTNFDGQLFWTQKSGGAWQGWKKVARDDEVMHLIGSETVAGDKTLTGNNIFTQPINGAFKTRPATFTDFANVASDMVQYAGLWYVNNQNMLNSPVSGVLYGIIEVIPAYGTRTGVIRYSDVPIWRHGNYVTTVDNGSINGWEQTPDNSKLVHNTGTETVAGDKTFTGNNTFTGSNTFTGQTSFWFKQITWTSGIMQGTWYLQRMGNFVFARFEKSQNTGTGNTSLSLPVGYRPINNWILDAERGQAGINGNGTVYIGTTYNDNTSMTFVYPTNDVWPTA